MSALRACVYTMAAALVSLGVLLVVFPTWMPKLIRYPNLLIAEVTDEQDSPLPAARRAEKLQVGGVPNMGRITPTLYRGGQPTEAGFQNLKRRGFQVIINFQQDVSEVEWERRIVEGLGMQDVSIPWTPIDLPTDRQAAEFVGLTQVYGDKKAFVHCEAGIERTGVMIALFRLAVHRWTAPEALAEMETYGFRRGIRWFWHDPHEDYIENFPMLLATDLDFRAVRLRLGL